MPNVARLTDAILGTTAGEHTGHIPPHGPLTITGEISGNVSPNVFVNGLPAAFVTSITTEHDSCCGTSQGVVAEHSATVNVNGKGIARLGDALTPHNGSAKIIAGSPNVFAN